MVSYRICSSVPRLAILFLAIFVLMMPQAKAAEPDNARDCITKVEILDVRGISLMPLIKPGSSVKLSYGYYNCHPVEREDIVAYNYAGNVAPIIKIVKAIPGDSWHLKKNKRGYQIIVNGRPLKNSKGERYQIPESSIQMLKLYVKDYPILPENTYLILGNQISGSLDSTKFGLIDKSDILGKVKRGQNYFLS